MAAVVLLELDDFLDSEVSLQIEHVARMRSAECIDRLIVVADSENGVVGPASNFSQWYCSRLVSWNSSTRMCLKRPR